MTDIYRAKFIQALENRSYRSLLIKRSGNECFLLIDVDGEPHVFPNKRGKAQAYRHVWQVKEWLRNQFQIDSENIEIEVR